MKLKLCDKYKLNKGSSFEIEVDLKEMFKEDFQKSFNEVKEKAKESGLIIELKDGAITFFKE
jgi:ABC-type enterochelin transport system substrate-binding protein